MKKLLLFLVSISFWSSAFAQNHHTRFERIDVQHYSFEVHLNDTTNRIEGRTRISVKFLKAADNVLFDLASINKQNKGMLVKSVKWKNEPLTFIHKSNILQIELNRTVHANENIDFIIEYSGVPIDGLVISENKYGDRTFFGDNWPDRAKHWLPCVDHPSDKATLEFKVYAPKHYEVISNGYLLEKKQLERATEFTHWKEDVPLSTKLMVIGVADFVVGNNTHYKNIPVNSWVFKQNEEQGFKNYKYGTKALEYFSELIGPYSYEKLSHVQSKTRYGGMENASCIFYHERTATSDQSQERLFAHEVAHQWFGNSVTEQNWHHVWLSEGFATYLTHVYKQHFYGEEIFREGLKNDREHVIRYSQQHFAPIIDTTVTEYIQLLNANSYQKAGWFLHMLRMNLGDDIFFNGLQKYYVDFQNSTALTSDFKTIMEIVSGKDLDSFFKQWLWQPGHPLLNIDWVQDSNDLTVTIKQLQTDYLFFFPIDFKLVYKNGNSEIRTIDITERECKFDILLNSKLKEIQLDPNIKVLFEIAEK